MRKKPAESSTLREQVARMLDADIRRSGHMAGTRLPPIKDLAARLNTSFSTVQQAIRILAGRGRLIVRHGSGVFVGPTDMAGTVQRKVILAMDIGGDVYGDFAVMLLKVIQQFAALPLVIDTQDPHWADAFLRAAREPEVTACIYRGCCHFPFHLFADTVFDTIPLVSVFGKNPGFSFRPAFRVLPDHGQAGGMVLEALQRQGMRRALVVGSRNMVNSASHPFDSAAEDVPSFHDWAPRGLPTSYLCSDTTAEPDIRVNPAQLVRELSGANGPCGVFCLRDAEAHAVARTLALHAPELLPQTFIVGYGNTPHSRYCLPPISTVDFDIEGLCRETGDILESILAGHRPEARTVRIAPRIILRTPEPV